MPTKALDDLTPKQRDFVLAYIKTKNATEAAISAGYSKKTAQEIGSENLSKPMIQAAIKSITQPILDKKIVNVENIISELADIGFAEEKKFQYYDKFGNLRFGFTDKIAALKALGDHAGAWEPQQVKHSGEVKLINVSFE